MIYFLALKNACGTYFITHDLLGFHNNNKGWPVRLLMEKHMAPHVSRLFNDGSQPKTHFPLVS
jgi:hypothetical protein